MPGKLRIQTTPRPRPTAKRCDTHLLAEIEEAEVTITITDPSAIVTRAHEEPVAAAREAQIAWRTLDGGFRDHRVGVIGAAYAAAYYMLLTDGAWERFIADPGWDDLGWRPKNTIAARNNILGNVLRYVFRAESNKVRRRVRIYAAMLNRRFYAGFKPEGVIPLIKQRGIENLRAEETARRKEDALKARPDPFISELNKISEGEEVKPPKLAWGKHVSPARSWPVLTLDQRREAARLVMAFSATVMSHLMTR